MKSLAICIPSYNRAHYISDALDSLIFQEESDYDIHVFDDCSQDNSIDVLSKYSNRIVLHSHPENLGYVGNLNAILSLSSQYQWIGILHCDDIHIGESVAVFKRHQRRFPDAGIFYAPQHNLDEATNIVQAVTTSHLHVPAGEQACKFVSGQIPCSSTFYNSKAIKWAGHYSMDFKYSADEEYNCRIVQKFDIVRMDTVIAGYRRHSGHLMLQTWLKPDFFESFFRMRARMLTYQGLPEQEANKEGLKRATFAMQRSCWIMSSNGYLTSVWRYHIIGLRYNIKYYLNLKILIISAIQCMPFLGRYASILLRNLQLNKKKAL